MKQWRTFVHLCKSAPKSDIFVLVVSFVLTVVFDLVIAIEIGLVMACFLFMKRMSDEAEIKGWKYYNADNDPDGPELREISDHIRVYEINGPMFFGDADIITRITTKRFTRCLVIRMRGVPALDVTALNALESLCENCKKKNITVIFSHVNEQPLKMMEKAGFIEKVGEENFCPNITAALDRAETL